MQGCTSHSKPVSLYICVKLPKTDDNDRTLDIWSLLLSRQVPHERVIPCQVIQIWTLPISEFDKNLPSCDNIWDENPKNFSLMSSIDQEKLLFKVSKVRLKAQKLGLQSKFIRFLELYISGGTDSRKVT